MEADLRRLLDELNTALDRLDSDDPAREDIEQLQQAVRGRLEHPHEHDHGFGEHLQEASLRFEVEHPRLNNALQAVINGLGSAGI